MGLILGTGLGAGIITRGELHSGLFCGAGEFGLIPYKDSIVEHYASGQFFRRFGSDGAQIHLEAHDGDPKALDILDQYGKHVGHAIKLILYSVAPKMIILGGSVSNSYPYFRKSLWASLEDFAYPCIVNKLKIQVSRIKQIAILGAASLVPPPKSKRRR